MSNSITQDIRFKQSVIEYSFRNGVTRAAIKHKVSRQNIYRWIKKYDGTAKSLLNRSRRPHHHPREHTAEEIKLIKNMKAKNEKTGLVVLWVKLRQRGYKRRIESLYRVMTRLGIYKKKNKKVKYKAKPYEQMKYPGERVQVDVKVVPRICLSDELKEKGERYYQYTAIDEYSRYRVIKIYEEQTTYSSRDFVREIAKEFPFKIECIQTDNGFEFTNRLGYDKRKTMFEEELETKGIRYKNIKPYTPRHNGKVERSHRKDQEYFYDRIKEKSIKNIEEISKKIASYIKRYNEFPMKPLNWKTPKQMLREYKLLNIC